jgi:hypothetical protein
MTYEMRFANRAFGESQAPYASPIARSVSQRRGNGNPCFAANFAFFSTESNEAPRISVFFFPKSS